MNNIYDGNCNSSNSKYNSINNNIKKKKSQTSQVLSMKVPLEDYEAYKITAEHLFEGNLPRMQKIALTFYLYQHGLNEQRFEYLKRMAKSDPNRIDRSFFIRRPGLVKLRRPIRYDLVYD